jgi:hypothetical protein
LQTVTFNPIEMLDTKRHNRKDFTCGVKQLDVFLQERARKEASELSLTFVLTYMEEPGDMLGYYSLSSTKLEADDLPEPLKKRIGQYGAIPATVLGRLATAQKFQRNKELRIGETLLIDAMFRTYRAAQDVASFGLIVDVLKSEAVDPTWFYRKYGFIKCTQTENRMYLPMGTIAGTLKEAGLLAG